MRNIVCIGGSTGALEAIQRLVRRVPADLPAAVFVVRHIAPESSGQLANILQSHSALPVTDAIDGQTIRNGIITVAPPDRHLLLNRTHIQLANGPKENWARPAIDPLFRTAAQHHGPRTIGIVLSGKLDDGTAGLWAIKRRGGFAVVQDPLDADTPEMPRHALAAVDIDIVADAEEIGALLGQWCRQSSDYSVNQLTDRAIEVENASLRHGNNERSLEEVGLPSGMVCPECSGQLWRMKEGPLRYRCHVGHALSAHSFLAQQTAVVENAAWQLIRAIEEDDQLCVQLLSEKISTQEKGELTSRLAYNREKLDRLRPLLFGDRGEAAMPETTDANRDERPNDGANALARHPPRSP
jgi:two-component system chemotaxis response regulator CheB